MAALVNMPPTVPPSNIITTVDGGEIEEAPPDSCDISPSETMTCDIMPTICEDPGAIAGYWSLLQMQNNPRHQYFVFRRQSKSGRHDDDDAG